MSGTVPSQLVETFERQKYHILGNHSAIKRCRWFHETLVNGRSCYKQKFYGIKTHQCIQMTPSLYYCTQQCIFCWRAQNGDLEAKWNELKRPCWDQPETIVEDSIKAQLQILSGYKDNPKTDRHKLQEAANPKHVAISLTGEPTLYKFIGDLIDAYDQRGFTTFLVTNGTNPSALSRLHKEPTQLYISVCAYDEKTYRQVCRPQIPDGWNRLKETLSLVSSFSCPTVIRITLAKGLNMENPEKYAKLIDESEPNHVESKAYMYVGFSRLRLSFDNMPNHAQIREFASELANLTGYKTADESPESRVVLLSRTDPHSI